MSASDLAPVFQQAGAKYNVDPDILRALVQQESNFNPNAFNKETQATGLMQFIPATAQAYGIDPRDPVQSINAGAQMFRDNLDRFNGNVEQAVAAHFAGPDQKQWGPKTQQYVSDVSNKFSAIKNNAGFIPSPQSQGNTSNVDAWLGGGSSQPAQSSSPDVDSWLGKSSAQSQTAQAPSGGATGSWGPTAGPSRMDSIVQGLRDPVDAGAQFLTHSLPSSAVDAVNSATQYVNNLPVIGPVTKALGMVPATYQQIDQNIAQQNQQYDAQRKAAGQTGIDWWRGAGNAVATAPLGLAMPGAGAGLLAKTAVGTGLGAANGVFTPVTENADTDYWGQKGKQVALGATTGAITTPLVSGIGSALTGATGAAQQKLAQSGVTMTPGQILGGAWKTTEDKLTSIPVLGDMIKNAQRRSVESFNTATYNQVLEPLGQKYSGPAGQEGVSAVQQMIGDAYDKALSKMSFRATDPAFQADALKITQMAQSLPEAQRQTFMNVMKTQIMEKLSPNGVMTGETLKGMQGELGRISRGYAGDASFDNRQLGAAIGSLKDAVESSLPRYNPADAVKGLQEANSAWANFVRLRGAAASQGAMNNEGVFTAAQLNSAVRNADKSVGKGATATGNALMQDWSSTGQSVLGNAYPDSGTPGRSLLAGLAGLGAAAVAGHGIPLVPAAGAAGAAAVGMLPYTSGGQKLAQALLMSRTPFVKGLGTGISRYGVPLSPALGAALLEGANR